MLSFKFKCKSFILEMCCIDQEARELRELYERIRTPAIDEWNAERLSGGSPCNFENWLQRLPCGAEVHEWNRCIASPLVWQSDPHWVHAHKYGNKRFEKGRHRHR